IGISLGIWFYFTIVYGVLNVFTGQGMLTRAGHTSPIVIHANNVVEVIDSEGGVPVGFLEEPDYQEVAFSLENDSRLYLYTDGITECENKLSEQFGEQRLIDLLDKHHELPLQQTLAILQQELNLWRGGEQEAFTDDVSMLTIHYVGNSLN
ncbi:PP2C family protein-serine/threonine phosphatase, partial [uncultured Agitococcus sp.]|uniref:PP2C family protein-serine/threonine phosphatase n=1 Tax=uncultured Agitococcus sp. TaxID=1506599 RepID=UPI0026063305